MRPFNLQEALAGKKVAFRGPVSHQVVKVYAVPEAHIRARVLVVQANGTTIGYAEHGYMYTEAYPDPWDLVMATEKKVGWVNVYKAEPWHDKFILADSFYVYATEDHAKEMVIKDRTLIATVKIEWEE